MDSRQLTNGEVADVFSSIDPSCEEQIRKRALCQASVNSESEYAKNCAKQHLDMFLCLAKCAQSAILKECLVANNYDLYKCPKQVDEFHKNCNNEDSLPPYYKQMK
ncbi:hypothetical protein CYY_010578 [Polysphondylium violaceum]|uniref:Uncharacterized protein n=1 Tax=Polysphondylium violaceum TaxID=133409 RepID=A0A8J4PJ44_9MYCE|nr:hypothetical protein CYY_010578 [Polysphondylium violaceum]